jgi:hypothetical protein
MAPPWVLLNRVIFFEHDVAASGNASEGGGEPTIGIARRVPSSEDITEANLAYMRDMKPDPVRADSLSSLILSLSTSRRTQGVLASHCLTQLRAFFFTVFLFS